MLLWMAQALLCWIEQLNWALAEEADLIVDSFYLESAKVFKIVLYKTFVSIRLEKVLSHLRFLALL